MSDSEPAKTIDQLTDSDRQFLEEYADSFSSLNVGRDLTSTAFPKGNPHKPLLLLAVIKLIADQKLLTNEFQFKKEIQDEFRLLWTRADPDSEPGQAKTPFEHLAFEEFWHLSDHPAKGKIAFFDDALFQLLQNKYLRDLLASILIRTYFSKNRRPDLIASLDISEQTYQDSSQYDRSISMARIPDTSRAEIIKALNQFDSVLRPTEEWKNWNHTKSKKYKFAINFNNQLYPVKKIISLATQTPVSLFSGGIEANTYVQQRGFDVVEIRKDQNTISLKDTLQSILSSYSLLAKGSFQTEGIKESFTKIVHTFRTNLSPELVKHLKIEWSVGKGNWAEIPWIAFLDTRETNTTQKGVYVVILFRKDMTGAYLTLAQGVTQELNQFGTAKTREILKERVKVLRSQFEDRLTGRFILDEEIDLRASRDLGKLYEASASAYKFYDKDSLPNDDEILEDLETMLDAYDHYIADKTREVKSMPTIDMNALVSNLISAITQKGFVFEPWQIATYVAALRTKPFIILAGVTGTGKSKLPVLVSDCTGGKNKTIPVRPDWTDSSELLGYVDLQQDFHPGPVLEFAKEAAENSTQHYSCIIDEMNLARVEQYFAEVLSCIENRTSLQDRGGYCSAPLLSMRLPEAQKHWLSVNIPPNFALIGTVNMDESSHGFSRKVLDRAFTIEMSEIHLERWKITETLTTTIEPWPVGVFYPRAIQLSELKNLTAKQEEAINQVIGILEEVNKILQIAQLQVGYRTRDEMALFLINATETLQHFKSHTNEPVNPLDIAIMMKILPRIIGGNAPVRQVVLQLLGWSIGAQIKDEDEAKLHIEKWDKEDRPSAFVNARFPRTAARLLLMGDRLMNEGFTSYWL